MKIFSSKSKKGFYFQGVGVVPEDAIEVSNKLYKDLLEGQAIGKVISFDEECPKLVDPISPDPAKAERAWRDSELLRADIELFKVQDTDQKAMGSVTDWRFYRKSLRAWPESLNFPDKVFRPKSPDSNKE